MPTMRPLYGGCPLLGGSVMGGSTVYLLVEHIISYIHQLHEHKWFLNHMIACMALHV